MIFSRVLLLLSIAAGTAASSFAVQSPTAGVNGDIAIDKRIMNIDSRGPREISDEVRDVLDELDPVASAQLQHAVDSGEIGYTEHWDRRAFGVHDYNTISVKTNLPPAAKAITLLHEWAHVVQAEPHLRPEPGNPIGPGNIPFTPGDARIPPTPPGVPLPPDCYHCHHFEMVTLDYYRALDRLCNLPAPHPSLPNEPANKERRKLEDFFLHVISELCDLSDKCGMARVFQGCEEPDLPLHLDEASEVLASAPPAPLSTCGFYAFLTCEYVNGVLND